MAATEYSTLFVEYFSSKVSFLILQFPFVALIIFDSVFFMRIVLSLQSIFSSEEFLPNFNLREFSSHFIRNCCVYLLISVNSFYNRCCFNISSSKVYSKWSTSTNPIFYKEVFDGWTEDRSYWCFINISSLSYPLPPMATLIRQSRFEQKVWNKINSSLLYDILS